MASNTYSADVALADALVKLKSVEEDNLALKTKLKQLMTDSRALESTGGGGEWSREIERLKKQNSELMHVNSQWDLEYKDLEETFRRYRVDAQRGQGESHSAIAKLKETKDGLSQEIGELQLVISRKDKELSDLRSKVRGLQEELRQGGGRGRMGGAAQDRLKGLEEENSFLRQQLKTYQDDFNAERRDRERLGAEKETLAVRYEAELTSLKLQLDRCRSELVHYTAEANRLSQQLRLKSHMEEEQYKKHLESSGYLTRAPNGHLPPLDPFVEMDEEIPPPPPTTSTTLTTTTSTTNTRSQQQNHAPRQPSPRLLVRGVDMVHALSNSNGAQTAFSSPSSSQQLGSAAGVNRSDSQGSQGSQDLVERSRSPIVNGYHLSPAPQQQTRHSMSPAPSPSHAPSSRAPDNFQPSFPPSMTNNAFTSSTRPPAHQQNYPPPTHPNNFSNNSSQPVRANGFSEPPTHTNGFPEPHNGYSNGFSDPATNTLNGYHIVDASDVRGLDSSMVAPAPQVHANGRGVIPPMETKGRYSCPRCERKFESKKICNDHKARCIL